jgi:F-type H+-transporting ATPase subunit epsilon
MSDRTLRLEVITPDRVVYSNDHVVSVIAPGVEGYLGVMANRAPILTALDIGEIDFRKPDGDWDYIAVCGGFIEVFENKVTVLAETAELYTEIDVDRAEKAKARAQEMMAAHAPEHVDFDRAQAALKRALVRLNIAHKKG